MAVLVGRLEVGLDDRSSPYRIDLIVGKGKGTITLVKGDEQRCLLVPEECTVQDLWYECGEIAVALGNLVAVVRRRTTIVHVIAEIRCQPHEI